jgi:hypothetical protein
MRSCEAPKVIFISELFKHPGDAGVSETLKKRKHFCASKDSGT